jgi:6-pyruvoyl-tetrahydropterin synthase
MSNIIDIRIDTNDLFSGLQVSKEQVDTYVDKVIKNLSYAYLNQVESEAQRELHSTRNRYIQNLRFIDTGRMEGTIVLDYTKDPLIKMIEEGANAYDMKQYFLKSSKVKFSKNGNPFLTIPFRFATPSAVGESEVFQGKLPQEVYDIVKSKSATISIPGGGLRSQGVKLNELPEQYQIKSTRPAIPGFEAYEHKSSIYEGVSKRQDSVTKQNTYGSFRRVSENSDPRSWIHPGMKAKNLFEQALSNFRSESEITRSMDIIWEQMGFKTL